jgi:ABC-type multidrug transport system ATPase subunit
MRKTTGSVSGSIQLNGQPVTRESLSSVVAFAEQEDIHCPTATVGEALEFSASLRMPRHVTRSQRKAALARIARLLELEPLLPRMVATLSRNEMKRLTIAVEMSSLPSAIFCDEPTSFLSADNAAVVMRALRRVAATGRTVIW